MNLMTAERTDVRRGRFSWLFRCSAVLHAAAALLVLFVLARATEGSWLKRSLYLVSHENLVILSWVSSLLSVLAVVGTFAVLVSTLNRDFRLILQWAWLIGLIGAAALILNHLAHILLFPPLVRMLVDVPRPDLVVHMEQWEQLLSPVVQVFAPTCFAVCGLIFTGAMFRTRGISVLHAWWSLGVWAILLLGALSVWWSAEAVAWFQGFAVFMYIPWLWSMGERV
ncbi:hypothetical protein [Staphylospora marina]|uniref:hypothetical protein n=1 Tax=Staphylospora marina TaxID=2490858 RepID=UPI000F5C0810|nr:hypothetical protein [Staphylospora marina]